MAEEKAKTATEQFQSELQRRIRAGCACIFIRTFEEDRTLKVIKVACEKMKIKRVMYTWDCIPDLATGSEQKPPSTVIKTYLGENTDRTNYKQYEVASVEQLFPTFQTINKANPNEKAVMCVMDFHYYISGDNVLLLRSIKNTLPHMKHDGKCVIFIGPQLTLPEELKKDVLEMEFPLPDRVELLTVLEYVVKSVAKGTPDKQITLSDDAKERLCEAALGLTATEAEDLFSLSFAKHFSKEMGLDEDASVKTIIDGKKAIIKQGGVLDFINPDETFADVGGYNRIKRWFAKRKNLFSQDARDFGLPFPKGVLFVGVQGAGKSLVAKAIAAYWGVVLVRLDMGKIYNKFQGASEDNARRAIMFAEAVAPCVLQIDEIEKGMSGVKSSDETSGGVQARVVQTFLTWMQEKQTPVFLACTGNDISKLPPELLRKGRFDEIFFVDLPNIKEREEILKIHIRKRPQKTRGADGKITKIERKLSDVDIKKLAEASDTYTGAEIEQAVIDALTDCYNDGKRTLKMADVLKYFKGPDAFIPLSKTMETEIANLKKDALGRYKNASDSLEEDEPNGKTPSFLRTVGLDAEEEEDE